MMQKIFNQEIRFKDDKGNSFPDWEEKPLNKLSNVNPKTNTLPKSFYYIDLKSVENGVLGKVAKISIEDAPSRAQRLLSVDDVLFQTVCPYQKNNLFFKLNGIYVASTGYAQIRAKINSQFIFQVVHTDKFVDQVLKRCTGTIYPAINSNDLAKIPIFYPSASEEQQKIADFLSSLDDKIDLIATELSQTQTFKKGLLQRMFV